MELQRALGARFRDHLKLSNVNIEHHNYVDMFLQRYVGYLLEDRIEIEAGWHRICDFLFGNGNTKFFHLEFS